MPRRAADGRGARPEDRMSQANSQPIDGNDRSVNANAPNAAGSGHPRWVRATHWIIAASVITLAYSGFVILRAHPRLYWGAVGNDLTPALIELPISRNYQHGGWEKGTPFFAGSGSPVSAVRTYDIYNQNGWARSLHFLAGWFLVVTGAVYLLSGLIGGHLRRDLLPRSGELDSRSLGADLASHARPRSPQASGGPPYGILQKLSYCFVLFVAVPMMLLTGLTMAPAITAAYPVLLGIFGGSQSARTLHFVFFALLVLFLVVHVLMVVRSGLRVQIRAMTLGK
jgi:thiosulfate reductase cytochrome b subunit